MKAYAILSCLIISVFAQKDEQFDGKCPEVTTQANFNETRFSGEWYEIKKFGNALLTGDCGTPTYNSTGNGFNVVFPQRNLTDNGTSTVEIKLKRQAESPTPGKYDVYVKDSMQNIPQFVLLTDYDNFSVVWGCAEFSNKNLQRLSIYSRQPDLNEEALKRINQTLTSFRIDVQKLQIVEQSDEKCLRTSGAYFVYPTVVTNIMIIIIKIIT